MKSKSLSPSSTLEVFGLSITEGELDGLGITEAMKKVMIREAFECMKAHFIDHLR